MKRWAIVSLLAGLNVLGLGVRAARGEGDAGRPSGPPKVSAQDDGFSLELPVWHPAGRGDPLKLTATYTWNGKGPRRLEATKEEGNRVWRLTFADQPKPDEVAKLELRYDFTLTTEERKEVGELARQLVAAVLSAGVEAARTADFAAAMTGKIDQILATNAAQKLQKYASADGDTDAAALVLGQLGFKQTEGTGWQITQASKLAAAAGSQVSDLDFAVRMRDARSRLIAAPPGGHDPARKCGRLEELAKVDQQAATVVLRDCLPEIAKDLDAAATKEKKAEVQVKLRADAATLRANADKVSDRAALADVQQIVREEGSRADGYSVWASKLALVVAQAPLAEAGWKATEAALVAEVQTFTARTVRAEAGSTLVQGAERPRRYDVATGFIYVAGIDDLIIPTVISVCPSSGCLTAKEVAWDAPAGALRALSIDAGVRLSTVGTQDPRQSEKISFVLGLSYNPVCVLRLSAGLYAFENAQTRNWNAQPYVGLTFNVLNAAEILGALGLGEAAPKVDPVK